MPFSARFFPPVFLSGQTGCSTPTWLQFIRQTAEQTGSCQTINHFTSSDVITHLDSYLLPRSSSAAPDPLSIPACPFSYPHLQSSPMSFSSRHHTIVLHHTLLGHQNSPQYLLLLQNRYFLKRVTRFTQNIRL
ncbi:hypothetical protein AMECASPLE_033383 [Ameca splendens]|uniref:Uncharacterized protein n=1 Tax=Ameca splendens TaxID=208324 RepID=A0ABV0XVN0_9TELE